MSGGRSGPHGKGLVKRPTAGGGPEVTQSRRPGPDAPSAVELCGTDPRQVDLWVPLTGLLVFWLVVLAVYWLLPAWRVRRRRYALLG